jgi:hypothetical protein
LRRNGTAGMTGKSPRKKVDALYWQGRSRAAQACLDAAQQAYLLAEPGQNCNPVISQIVLSAMAFGDSLTARRAQVVNQQDHARAPRLLRDVLGNLLPEGQERRYRRILSFKDEVRNGTRQASRDDAGRLLADLEEFNRWAQELL